MRIRDDLTRLGLSQTAAAQLLGVNARTVRGWCEPTWSTGHRTVPTPIWLLLNLIEHTPGVRERLTLLGIMRTDLSTAVEDQGDDGG